MRTRVYPCPTLRLPGPKVRSPAWSRRQAAGLQLVYLINTAVTPRLRTPRELRTRKESPVRSLRGSRLRVRVYPPVTIVYPCD